MVCNDVTSTRTSLEPSRVKENDGGPGSVKDDRSVIFCLHRPVTVPPSVDSHSFSNGLTSVAPPHIDTMGATCVRVSAPMRMETRCSTSARTSRGWLGGAGQMVPPSSRDTGGLTVMTWSVKGMMADTGSECIDG